MGGARERERERERNKWTGRIKQRGVSKKRCRVNFTR